MFQPRAVWLLLTILGTAAARLDGARGSELSPPCFSRGTGGASALVHGELRRRQRCYSASAAVNAGRAGQLQYPVCRSACPLAFVPHGCALQPAHPPALLTLLAGRRLLLWGDSVMRGFFDYITQVHMRGLRASETVLSTAALTPKTAFPRRGGSPESDRRAGCQLPVVDGTRRPQCLRFNGVGGRRPGAEFCFVQSFKGVIDSGNSGCLRRLSPRDVVVFNTGLHYQRTERAAYRLALQQFVTSLRAAAVGSRGRGPVAVWRETSAQHFRRSAEFRRFEYVKLSHRCGHVGHAALRASNWRNQVAEEVVGRHLPILRVWNVSAGAPFAHTHVRVKAARGGLRLADCTHFCVTPSGMYAIWTTLLFNQLHVLLGGA